MWQKVWPWLEKTDQNKLIAVVFVLLLGVVLRDLFPYLWRLLITAIAWTGKRIGGKFGFRYFERSYLNWLVTELRELKLAGVVSADTAKKPKLEQVFVSLRIGEQPDRFSAVQAALAVVEELRSRRGKIDSAVIKGLKRDIDKATGAERKDAERIIAGYLEGHENRKIVARLVRIFRPRSASAKTEGILLEEFFERPHVAKPSSEYAAILLRKVLRDEQRMAILGSPGAGKTTLLQYIGLAYAKARAGERKLRLKDSHKKLLGAERWRLPVFVPLGTIAKKLTEPLPDGRNPSIVDVLPQLVPPDLEGDTKRFFASKLKKGRCIVLLDGLDEVPTDEEFRAVVRAIESLAVNYSKNQFVVTSRIAGWRTGVNADFKLTYVSDLTDEQVEFFVDTWCSAVELNAVVGSVKRESKTDRINRERRAHKRAEQMKSALRDNPGIRQLASNPMLLSIIALVHHSLSSLPQDRSKLYSDCSKILLEQWDISRGLHVDDTHLKFEQKEAVMRHLAYALHTGEIGKSGGGREASRGEMEKVMSEILPNLGQQPSEAPHLLRILVERSGLILERQRDVLAFAHLTFQEYFTARHLSRGDREENRDFLLRAERVHSEWWRETILLYCGMLPDSSEFLRRLHSLGSGDLIKTNLRLAGWCLGEAVQIKQPQVRHSIASDLLKVRTKGAVSKVGPSLPPEITIYLVRWSKTESWYSHAIVASINAETPDKQRASSDAISAMLGSQQVETLQAGLQSLRFLPPNVITIGLTRQLPDLLIHQDPNIRRQALATIGVAKESHGALIAEKAVTALSSDNPQLQLTGLQICRELGASIGQYVRLLGSLNRLEQGSRLNWRIRQEFAAIFPFVVSYASDGLIVRFFKFVVDDDEDVRRDARNSLSKILSTSPNEKIVERTIGLLKSSDAEERSAAATIVGQVDSDTVVRLGFLDQLVNMFADKSEQVREVVTEALRKLAADGLGGQVCVAAGNILAQHERIGKACALKTLSAIPCNESLAYLEQHLLGALESGEKEIQIEAAAALGTLPLSPIQEKAIPKLVKLSAARDGRLRANAVRSLGLVTHQNPTEQVLQTIYSCLDDRDRQVRTAAAKSAALCVAHGDMFVDRLLRNLASRPRVALFDAGIFRSTRLGKGMTLLMRPWSTLSQFVKIRSYDERDYWGASAKAVASVNLTDPDRAINELSKLLIPLDPLQVFKLSYIFGAMSEIGAKLRSPKVLDLLFKIVRELEESLGLFYPLRIYSTGYVTLHSPLSDDPEGNYLNARIAAVAKMLPTKHVVPRFRAALEDSVASVRLMALEVAAGLDPSVTSELYLDMITKLIDEDKQVRAAAWRVVKTLSLARELWVIDPGSERAGKVVSAMDNEHDQLG